MIKNVKCIYGKSNNERMRLACMRKKHTWVSLEGEREKTSCAAYFTRQTVESKWKNVTCYGNALGTFERAF